MLFGGGLGADLELAAAPGVGVDDALPAEDEAAGGEIRTLHDFEHLGERRIGSPDQRHGGLDDFGQVVRRDVGGHAHGDARGAVDQQVRDARGKDFRLDFAIVVIGAEIDGLLVQIFEQGSAMRDSRASVYRIAAGGSPSTEPKLPWPSTSG